MKRSLVALIGILLPTVVHAYSITQTGWNCQGFLYCGTGGDLVTLLATSIVNNVWKFIGAVAVVAFFYGAIMMITSQGQEGQEAGKKALIYASLGLVCALLVRATIQFVCGYIYSLAPGGPPPTVCP